MEKPLVKRAPDTGYLLLQLNAPIFKPAIYPDTMITYKDIICYVNTHNKTPQGMGFGPYNQQYIIFDQSISGRN